MASIHSVYHHIRHTRPKWYEDYHKWEYHETLHWITFAFSAIVIFMGFINAVLLMQNHPLQPASAATTTVNQQVNAGTLGVTSQGSATLSTVTVNSTSSQNSTGNLGTVTVTDNTGSGNGWSVVSTSTDFYKVNSAVKTNGSNNTVTTDSGSTYVDGGGTSLAGDTYTITISTGGTLGSAKYTVTDTNSDSGDQTAVTAGTSVSVGSYGIKVTFAAATYVIGDSWTIRVDVIPVTGLLITPVSPPTAVAGSLTGVTAGSAHTFTGTNDSTTIMSASAGNGMGSYSDNPALQLSVPAATYANSYASTVTITAS